MNDGFACFNGFCRGEFRERPAQTQNEMEREERSALEERHANCKKEKSNRNKQIQI